MYFRRESEQGEATGCSDEEMEEVRGQAPTIEKESDRHESLRVETSKTVLKPGKYEALCMCGITGYSVEEIAEQLNISAVPYMDAYSVAASGSLTGWHRTAMQTWLTKIGRHQGKTEKAIPWLSPNRSLVSYRAKGLDR